MCAHSGQFSCVAVVTPLSRGIVAQWKDDKAVRLSRACLWDLSPIRRQL